MDTYWLDAVLNDAGVVLDIVMYLTIPVHIVVLITLIKYRKDELFKHAFFILMTSVGIADGFRILTFVLGNKLASYGWVPQLFLWVGDNYARWYYVFNFLFGGVQIVGHLAIALNRFTAYIFPLKHNQIWESDRRHLLWFCIFLQWFLGFLAAAPLFPSGEYAIFHLTTSLGADNKSISLLWRPGDDDEYNSIVLFPIKIPMGIAIAVIYVIIFCTALGKQIRNGTAASSVTEKLALKMAVIGLLSAIGLFISQATVALSQYIDISVAAYWFFYNLGNNLLAAVNPFALLAFSKSFRDRCKVVVFGKSQQGVNRTSAHPGAVVGSFLTRRKGTVGFVKLWETLKGNWERVMNAN